MYQGEVHIGQEQLKEFLRAAQLLQVRGLTDVPAPAPMTTLDQKASPVRFLLFITENTQSPMLGARKKIDAQPGTKKLLLWISFFLNY